MSGVLAHHRRLRHPWLAATLWILIVVAVVASFLAGRLIPTPERDAIAAAQQDILVDAPVERRIVDPRTAIAGSIAEGGSIELRARVLPDTPVVTRQPLTAGIPFVSGNLIAIVADVPYFALAGPLPLYRNLVTGDEGDDVIALQRALNASGADIVESGWVDWDTITAVREIYSAADMDLPSITEADGAQREYIPYENFIDAGLGAGAVISAVAVGVWVDSDTPLVSLRVAPNHAIFRADAALAPTLTVGDTVVVQAGAAEYATVIDSVGEFRDAADTQRPGRDVVLVSDDPAFLSLPVGSSVTALIGGEKSENIAVPLVAVRQDNDGDFVLRRVEGADGEVSYERVAVQVIAVGGGWAALTDGGVAVGERVRVS